MYKLHLILKYLRKRRIAWVSLVAVMLCSAMVLVVISVMGGWLRMFKDQFAGLTGDIIVHGQSLTGFPHYEEMIARLEALPEVEAAVPSLETFALININNISRQGVQVVGYPIERIGCVTRFQKSLHRQWEAPREQGQDPPPTPGFDPPLPPEVYRDLVPAPAGARQRTDPAEWPGMIVGSGVVGIRRDRDGNVVRPAMLLETWVKLTTVAVDPSATSPDLSGDKAERTYWIVDDSRTRVWQIDNGRVYVPFDLLQRDLRMDGYETTDPRTGERRVVPARTHELHVRTAPGADLTAARQRVRQVVDEVRAQRQVSDVYPIAVETWLELHGGFIAAIEKEKALVTFLFGMISIVAVFLIFCIFYMIVVEKTRDIGIVKSVGATSAGVAGVFLGYGAAIGVVGGGLGMLVGWLIVSNINYLHTQMGRLLGIEIWRADVYAFDVIPDTVDWGEAWVIALVAVLSAVLGAVLPAMRAARMNPVEALRFE